MWPRLGPSSFVTKWLVATLAASIIAALDGGLLASWFALVPSHILHGQIWRLVTWPLIEPGPTSLIFTCVAIYKLGGDLAVRWGDRRLRRFVIELAVTGAVATTLVAALAGRLWLCRYGGIAMTEALVIAWARQFPTTPLRLYGLLTLRGPQLVQITLATAVLYAIYVGPVFVAPELACCVLAVAYPGSLLRR